MKGIVVKKVGSFSIEDIPDPLPLSQEVTIEVAVAGLCRTDLKIIQQGHRDLVLPRIPGEEVVGRIVAVGSEVTDFCIGQRVYIYPGTSCGVCTACTKDAGNLCTSMQIMGFHRDGGFAEKVIAPAKSLLKIPDILTDSEAVFAEPLSCCINALEQARVRNGESICIWGGGPAGTLLSRLGVMLGATTTVVETDPLRRKLCDGEEQVPHANFDICIVAVGSRDTYIDALKHLTPRGRLVVFSGLSPKSAHVEVDLNQLHYLEQSITGAYGCSFRHSELALDYLQHRQIQVLDLVSHCMPMCDLSKALSMVENRTGMKIHLYPF